MGCLVHFQPRDLECRMSAMSCAKVDEVVLWDVEEGFDRDEIETVSVWFASPSVMVWWT